MEIIRKISFILIVLASTQLYGAAEPQFNPSSFIPEFAWQKSLNDDEAKRFIAKEPFLLTSLQVGELIMWHSTKGSWHFAQFQRIEGNAIHCWRYNSDSGITEAVSKPFDRNTFYKLSPFWKHVLEKTVDPTSFEKEIDAFNAINQDVSAQDHADTVIIPLGNRIMINGDIHGDIRAMAANLVHETLFYNLLNAKGEIANESYALATGDIGDRGEDDVQCWCVLLELSNKNPGKVFITRGNHESDQVASIYGFKNRFMKMMSASKWHKMQTIWSKLPHFILFGIQTPGVDFYDFIMAVHAGFDPNWNMTELMQAAISNYKNVIVGMDLPAKVKAINYNWSDLIPVTAGDAALDSQAAARIDLGMRGAGEDRLNHALIRQYCRNVSKSTSNHCGLSAIFRGHDHAAVKNIGNIGRLIDNPLTPWKALTSYEWYPLSESYDTYTLITARNIPSVDSDHNWNAYGIIEAGFNGRWYLQPVKFS